MKKIILISFIVLTSMITMSQNWVSIGFKAKYLAPIWVTKDVLFSDYTLFSDTTGVGAVADSIRAFSKSGSLIIEKGTVGKPTYSALGLSKSGIFGMVTLQTKTNSITIYEDPTTTPLQFTGNSSFNNNLTVTGNAFFNGEINQILNVDTLQFKITQSTTKINSTNPLSFGDGSDTLIFNNDTLTNTTTLSTAIGNLGNKTVTMDTVFTNYISTTSMVILNYTVTLVDSGTFIFPNAKTVSFDIFIKDGDERAIGTITTTGVVTIGLSFGTTLWSNTNVDLKYCIYDNGTAGILRNNSGTTKTFYLTLKYNKT